MKSINKYLTVILAVTSIAFITGCDTTTLTQTTETTDTIDQTTTTQSDTSLVKLSLTDAPVDDENIAGVYITITGIKYEYINSTQWLESNLEAPITLNLLDLRDGKTRDLAALELKQGEIEHIRFMLDLDNCYITFKDDPERKEKIEIPSGEQTGFKSTNGFVVGATGETNITADFDVRKSLTLTKKGYKMKPTIKLINNQYAGMIAGNITLETDNSTVVIYSYKKGSFQDSEATSIKDFSNAYTSARIIQTSNDFSSIYEGRYRLYWIMEGEYDLVIAGYNNLGEFENVIGFVPSVEVQGAYSTTDVDINKTTIQDSL